MIPAPSTLDASLRLDGLLREGKADPDALEPALRDHVAAVAVALEGASPERRRLVREQQAEALAPLTRGSALLRAVAEGGSVGARGFPVLDRVLRPRLEDSEALGAVFDRFLQSTHPLAALRARSLFLRREIRFRLRARVDERPLKVLVLGCGPRPDVVEAAWEHGPEPLEAVLVDGDVRCLEAARRQAPRGLPLHLHAADPVQVALTGAPEVGTGFDLVLAPFFLDFVPDEIATRCIDFCFERLRPGAQVVLGAYHQDLTAADRLVLEWWLRWFPYFRTTRALSSLWRRTKAGREGSAVGLVRGPNVYVVAQRPR